MAETLYLFTHDLRITDNPTLQRLISEHHSGQITLCCAYCLSPALLTSTNYSSKQLGKHRLLFDLQSVQDVASRLIKQGIKFELSYTSVARFLLEKGEAKQFDTVYVAQQFGWNEEQLLNNTFDKLQIEFDYSAEQFIRFNNHTLFQVEQLPFELSKIPNSFTKFRKLVEKQNLDEMFTVEQTASISGNDSVSDLQSAKNDSDSNKRISKYTTEFVDALEAIQCRPEVKALYEQQAKPQLQGEKGRALEQNTLNELKVDYEYTLFEGGERAAHAHLEQYFYSTAPSTYKETRNALDDWASSTKFSPWLANGCVSPKQIWQQVVKYEAHNGANDSTYWTKFELLWREFFQWQALNVGNKLFWFSGLANSKPLTSFYPTRFKKWCLGQTPYPIVNAAMHQLNQTGYMSNRARQLVASCFIHELQMDWRYGAAYFQQQLIDFDVASNWGNWQYLAGVGFDPRGSRQFNLEKQTNTYDPDHEFIKKWAGYCDMPMDDVDMADWPTDTSS